MPPSQAAFAALLSRAPASYGFLAEAARDSWSWEFLRRSAVYATAWRDAQARRDPSVSVSSIPLSVHDPRRWDLCTFRRSGA